ncbi:J domain-containing protein [Aliidiomarina indica]|uniref:J domain-containing protein n=1 Tax=Aliidiomarina indica TaxID=2749147 RepID=UPI00188DD99D|nr:J domain-containing protein [Aliidiomarina indica]
MFGRLLGTLLGFAAGRILGAVLGFLLGYWVDMIANERGQSARQQGSKHKPSSHYREADIYEFFGVSSGVSDRELKKAYHQKMKQCHPDRLPSDASKELKEKAKQAAQEVQDLYDRLRKLRRQKGTGE